MSSLLSSPLFSQAVQLTGSLAILVPFVLVQLGRLRTGSLPYALANALGSGVLAFDALHGGQWGFLLLEGVWALVSAGSLASLLRARSR